MLRAGALLTCVLLAIPAHADDWPQWLGPQRDGVWREQGILKKFPAAGPKVVWRAPVGAGYSGPAVAGGRVYLTDRVRPDGTYFDAKGFRNGPSKERVLCFNEATGKPLWQHTYECEYEVAYPLGPRATPLIRDGMVYILGAMGDLLCLDAQTGKPKWTKNFPRDLEARVPIWGFAAHPLLDGDRLICLVGGGKDQVAVAFHKDTGKVIWHALSAAEPGYAAPMIYRFAAKAEAPRQLIIWHPESVNSLNPETGAVYWSQPFRVRAGLTIPTPRVLGDQLFVTSFYNGPMMLRVGGSPPAASVVWKGKGRGEKPDQTDGLHAIMPTPFIRDGFIYGICSYGELRCVKAATGERVWSTLQATGGKAARWGNAFLIPNGDLVFLFDEHGDLILARLTPEKYEELGRANILVPTNRLAGRPVVWSHPAFANKCMFVRNDREMVCVSLAEEK